MTEPRHTHYLNADFDLSLRPRPRQLAHANLVRQAGELSALALLGADARDDALVRVAIPQEFLDYLTDLGLPVPRVVAHPGSDPATALRPFGWNAEAIRLNRLHDRPVEHPSFECVRRVNSRSFALGLERELFPDATHGTLLTDLAALERLLAGAAPGSEWIVKSEHGNAGLANRRLRPELTAADRRFVVARLEEDDRLLVEPFRRRLRDWSMVFDAPFDPATLRFHDTVCTADGGLIGALYDPAAAAARSREAGLAQAAERAAARLTQAGYFGPVCADGFSFGDGPRPEVRPLVDLNCRRTVSDGVFRLWRRWAPERTLYFRFFAGSRLRLPGDLRGAVRALGADAFDPRQRSGVLFGSPTRLAGADAARRPLKLATLFFADDRTAALALAERFRERFGAGR